MSTPFQGLDIATTAQSLKDWVVAAFESAGHPLPERRYVAPGDPTGVAWDCEQFVVTLSGVGWGQAQDEAPTSPRTGTPIGVFGVRHAVLHLAIVRCTPRPETTRDKLPTVAAIDAAGWQFFKDAGLLSQAMLTWAADAQQHIGREGHVQTGAIEPVGPDGGYHGIVGTMAITVAALT